MPEPIHILLIEDDEDDIFIVKKMLGKKEGTRPIHLRTARTLAEGLREIGSGRLNAVLLDLTLPDSERENTFSQIRAKAASVPVIILTGLDDEQLASSMVQKGAQDYIVKGKFAADTLLRSIRYAIERQQMVSDLEEMGRHLKTIIDSNADAMIITNRSGIIEFVNRSAEDLYSCSADELTGHMFGLLPDHGSAVEIGILKPAGDHILAEMRVVKTVWRRQVARLILLRDITRQKKTEESLRLYRDHLKEIVQRRTEELSKTNEDLSVEIEHHKRTEAALRESVRQLETHSRAQLDFVSNVSHELKTPLSSVGYAVSNLLAGVAGPVPERMGPYLTMISEDIDRLGATIGDILDMSRIEAQTLVLRQVKLHLSRLVLHTISAVQDMAIAKRQRISFSARQDRSFVSVDPQRFERVVLNVVGNSMKYTPDGGLIEVRIFSEPGMEQSVLLSVVDNGIGIEPEHIDHVTERYYRVGEHVDGTGLGLALCKEITELHGGTLEVKSPPDGRPNGTQVTISLPTTAPPTVLAVDDDPQVLDLVERQLAIQGYQVVPCTSGAKALDTVTKHNIDVLVADMLLPNVDGVELISRIKTDPKSQHMPIVVVTGAVLDEGKLELLDGFGIPIVTKPWKKEELMAAIDDITAGRHFPRQQPPDTHQAAAFR